MSHILDLACRNFWRITGRRVNTTGAESWLDAPISHSSHVGGDWVAHELARHGGVPATTTDDAGLLPSMDVLNGSEFSAADLDPIVRDFYEHTARWRMEVWSSWAPLFWPAGEVISRLWGKRVEQLALPMRPLDVAHGMDSSITPISDHAGTHVASAWTRTLRVSGGTVFSGAYSARTLPGSTQPSVHVAFPLESGNLQVLLRPTATPTGGLLLESSRGAFGADGAYVVVRGRRTYACRAPIHETFHVYVDPDGVLRTDHALRMFGMTALRLHYKMERSG